MDRSKLARLIPQWVSVPATAILTGVIVAVAENRLPSGEMLGFVANVLGALLAAVLTIAATLHIEALKRKDEIDRDLNIVISALSDLQETIDGIGEIPPAAGDKLEMLVMRGAANRLFKSLALTEQFLGFAVAGIKNQPLEKIWAIVSAQSVVAEQHAVVESLLSEEKPDGLRGLHYNSSFRAGLSVAKSKVSAEIQSALAALRRPA